eukprot:2852544-Pleurochrysis_carterae.AAC.2
MPATRSNGRARPSRRCLRNAATPLPAPPSPQCPAWNKQGDGYVEKAATNGRQKRRWRGGE